MKNDEIRVEVVIEVPRGSFVKRGSTGAVDFVSPLPCPFNYGAVHDFVGGDNDLLDAVVLGPRLPLGRRVTVPARGAVGLLDRGIYDDKLICSHHALGPGTRRRVVLFFHLYAWCKRMRNRWMGRTGPTRCEGWGSARAAIRRAVPRRTTAWKGPVIPF